MASRSEGTFRAHQGAAAAKVRSDLDHLAQLEGQAINRNVSSTTMARYCRNSPELAPQGNRRMSASPHANGGALTRDIILRPFQSYAVPVSTHGQAIYENTRSLGAWLRDIFADNAQADNFRLFCRTRQTRTGWMISLRCKTAASSGQRWPVTTMFQPIVG